MLFELNIYRLGRERRRKAAIDARSLGTIVLLGGLSLVMLLIYSEALRSAGRGLDVAQARLEQAEQSLNAATEKGNALTSVDLLLLRERAAQVPWSSVLRRVSDLTPTDAWYMRLSLIEGSAIDDANAAGVFHIFGVVKADGRDESVTELMSFVDALRADAELSKYFRDAKLATMRWEDNAENALTEGLSFEAILPLEGPTASEVDYDDA